MPSRRARSLVAAVALAVSTTTVTSPASAADSVSIPLGASPLLFGTSLAAAGSGGGLTFKADCSGTGILDAVLTLRMAVSSGNAQFAYSSPAAMGATSVTPGEGDKVVLQLFSLSQLTPGELLPLAVAAAKDDGTVYQGVITIGVVVLGKDCFVNGMLLRSLKKSTGLESRRHVG